MRISTQQFFNRATSEMQAQQTQLAETQQRIATGKQHLRPSDDPIATARIIKLKEEIGRHEKFEDNLNSAERRLVLEESALDQVNTTSDRLKELAILAGNVALNDSNRRVMADEVDGLVEQLAGLMNTKDAQGEYLFAGAKGRTMPFQRDAAGTYAYHGDEGQRKIQIGPELQIATGDSGRQIFEVVPGDTEVTLLGADTALISAPTFADDDAETFEAFSEKHGDVTLTVADDGAGGWTFALLNGAGSPVEDEAGTAIAGMITPASPIEVGGLSFSFNAASLADGARVTLRAEQPRHSLLETAQTFSRMLREPVNNEQSRTRMQEGVADMLSDLALSKEGTLSAMTGLGARMNTLTVSRDVGAETKLQTQTALSVIEDLDYATAISDFSLQELALEAARQTFARINSMTLFDHLR